MKSLVVFNTMGIKGTFCIPTGFLNQPGHITSSELLTIAAAGSDICGHTISHLSLLQPINAFTLRSELWSSKDTIETLLWRNRVNVATFAYPYGDGDDNAVVRAAVARFYSGARTTDWGIAYAGTDPLAIPSYSFQTDISLAFWKAEAKRAHDTGGWINFVVHFVDQPNQLYNINSADLAALIVYMKSIGMAPITGEQGVHLVLNKEAK